MYVCKGVVKNAWTKTVNTKKGPGNVHYVEVDGYQINTGFRKTFEVGEDVTIYVDQKYGEFQMVPGNRGSSGAADISTATVSSTGSSGGNPTGKFSGMSGRSAFPLSPTDHAISICRQNALTNANTLLATLYIGGKKAPPSLEELTDQLVLTAHKLSKFTTGALDAEIKESLKKEFMKGE